MRFFSLAFNKWNQLFKLPLGTGELIGLWPSCVKEQHSHILVSKSQHKGWLSLPQVCNLRGIASVIALWYLPRDPLVIWLVPKDEYRWHHSQDLSNCLQDSLASPGSARPPGPRGVQGVSSGKRQHCQFVWNWDMVNHCHSCLKHISSVTNRGGGSLNKRHKTQLRASVWVHGILMQHCVCMASNEICRCSHFLAAGKSWQYQYKCRGERDKAFRTWRQHQVSQHTCRGSDSAFAR